MLLVVESEELIGICVSYLLQSSLQEKRDSQKLFGKRSVRAHFLMPSGDSRRLMQLPVTV
jgi:hypothetical protein